MKLIFGLILALALFESHAAEIRVSKISLEPEMDRSFILKSQLTEKVVLDCQSFIHGLKIGGAQGTFYMLDPWECEALYGRVKSSVRKFQKHCIDADDIIRSDYTCN